jgi:hypothetical protein
MMDCPKCGKLCGSDEFGVHINECVSPDTHTIGSHSDDRGGESDYPCYCDTPVSPNTNIDELDDIVCWEWCCGETQKQAFLKWHKQNTKALLSAAKEQALINIRERVVYGEDALDLIDETIKELKEQQ